MNDTGGMTGALREVGEIEPVVGRILAQAFCTSYRIRSRAQVYERYKHRLARYVGEGARNQTLATSRHYEAVMTALNLYLPEEW